MCLYSFCTPVRQKLFFQTPHAPHSHTKQGYRATTKKKHQKNNQNFAWQRETFFSKATAAAATQQQINKATKLFIKTIFLARLNM